MPFSSKLPVDYKKKLEEQLTAVLKSFRKNNAAVCRFFLKGSCVLGEACPLRHQKHDKVSVCKHYLAGVCKKGLECEFLHVYDPSRLPLCSAFLQQALCTDPECLLLHVASKPNAEECPWYNRGFCKHGPNCKFSHVRRQLCPFYMAGFCWKGKSCALGHAKFELPPVATGHGGKLGGNSLAPLFCSKCLGVGHGSYNCSNSIDVQSLLNKHSS